MTAADITRRAGIPRAVAPLSGVVIVALLVLGAVTASLALLGIPFSFTLFLLARSYTLLDYRFHHGHLPLGWVAVC